MGTEQQTQQREGGNVESNFHVEMRLFQFFCCGER